MEEQLCLFRLPGRVAKKLYQTFTDSLEIHPQTLLLRKFQIKHMSWTLELAVYLEDAPWPAVKEELIDYAERTGAPWQVVANLEDLPDDDNVYESIEDIWEDYPSKEDFLFNEDEY